MMAATSNIIFLADYRTETGARPTGSPQAGSAEPGGREPGPDSVIEAERLVLILLRECDDLDSFMAVFRTLSRKGVRFSDLPAEPMVLAKWAKQFRNMEPATRT